MDPALFFSSFQDAFKVPKISFFYGFSLLLIVCTIISAQTGAILIFYPLMEGSGSERPFLFRDPLVGKQFSAFMVFFSVLPAFPLDRKKSDKSKGKRIAEVLFYKRIKTSSQSFGSNFFIF
jgi:hypothetical protein